MDTKYVALQCHYLIKDKKWTTLMEVASADHCLEMCETIMDGKMSDEKEQRWVGWVQACMYMHGVSTLEELKILNKKGINEKEEKEHKQYAVYSEFVPSLYQPVIYKTTSSTIMLLGPYDTEQEANAARITHGYENDSTCYISEFEEEK